MSLPYGMPDWKGKLRERFVSHIQLATKGMIQLRNGKTSRNIAGPGVVGVKILTKA